jgi:hypothetical protein
MRLPHEAARKASPVAPGKCMHYVQIRARAGGKSRVSLPNASMTYSRDNSNNPRQDRLTDSDENCPDCQKGSPWSRSWVGQIEVPIHATPASGTHK